MFCKFCSAQIDPDAEHCYACGRRLSEQDKLLSKPEIEHKMPIEYTPKSVGSDDIWVYNLDDGTTAMQKTETNKKSSVTAVVITVLSVLAVVGITLSVLFATGVISINTQSSHSDSINNKESETKLEKDSNLSVEDKSESVTHSTHIPQDYVDAVSAIAEADNVFYGKTCYDNYLVKAILNYCNSIDIENAPTERVDFPDNTGYAIAYLDENGNVTYGKAYDSENQLLREMWLSPLSKTDISTMMNSIEEPDYIRGIIYDGNGSKIEEYFFNPKTNLHLLFVVYDDNGELEGAYGVSDWYTNGQYKYEHHFAGGDLRTSINEYDEIGKIINTQVFDVNGNLYRKFSSEYNENGQESVQYEYDADGNLIKKTVYEYDASGSCIGYIEYDEAGNIINEASL